MERWMFGEKADELANKVLNGIKTATCSLFDGEYPQVGEKSIIIDSNNKDVCMIELIESIVLKFNEITEEMAVLEGEGNLEEWKKIHIHFFSSELNIEENIFDKNILILYEKFKVIENLKEKLNEDGK
jgi:uncharacterized protein YhfF